MEAFDNFEGKKMWKLFHGFFMHAGYFLVKISSAHQGWSRLSKKKEYFIITLNPNGKLLAKQKLAPCS